MIAPIETVYSQAQIVLSRFLDSGLAASWADMVLELRPQPQDYERVFVKEMAAAAREAYSTWWAAPPPLLVSHPEQTTLLLVVAMSEELGQATERAQQFPGGYAEIAKFLQPGNVWVCWKFLALGQPRGTAFDGLVYLDGRWAWFPKPHKVLMAQRQPYSHFSE